MFKCTRSHIYDKSVINIKSSTAPLCSISVNDSNPLRSWGTCNSSCMIVEGRHSRRWIDRTKVDSYEPELKNYKVGSRLLIGGAQ